MRRYIGQDPHEQVLTPEVTDISMWRDSSIDNVRFSGVVQC